jgi:hypothetical protein
MVMETTTTTTLTQSRIGRYMAFIMLDLTFLAAIGIIANWQEVLNFSPLLLIELSFATLRLAHSVSYNAIFEWLRAPFTTVVPDSCGAGENVHAKEGRLKVFGELLACPICTGTWSALILVSLVVVIPPVGLLLVHILAIAGVYELLHRVAEYYEWKGRAARVMSGKISPDKE